MDLEDVKMISLIVGVALLVIVILTGLVVIPVYLGQYWECANLTNLYNGEYELKFIIPNGCLVKANGIWVGHSEFQNWANLNIIK